MIEFSNVSLIYPNSINTVLEDLSFTVAEGEFVLVIGATGLGKSSLLRLINGLVPHHTGGILAGEVSVDGTSTRSVKPGALAHLVGIVGQNPLNGFVTDTVEEELAFGLEALNFPPDVMRKRVEEVLDLMSLAALRSRSITSLSGGEQQRVAIGSALVMHPKVLVLDEPTSALDPIAAEEVLSILQRLVHDLSLTVIVAEHRLERVIHFADRIIYIQANGETKIGTPQEILKDSEIAPPIVHLARALDLPEVALSVREMRRATQPFREKLLKIDVVTGSKFEGTGKELVKIKKLSLSYENSEVLHDISLNIHEGEIVAIMGRNGAGKSSLLRSMVGIVTTYEGQIEIDGRAPNNLKAADRSRSIGFIPQEPSDLLYGQSVGQECTQADKDNRVLPGTTLELLQKLVPGISPSTHPRDLSEGQRLALALSVVLSAKPNLLVLDEPTRGLDYSAKASLINQLRGHTVVLATHDVELVAEFATRVIFIAEGEIVADGSTIDVLLSSPAFAPQIAKVMSPSPWLTVNDVIKVVGTSL